MTRFKKTLLILLGVVILVCLLGGGLLMNWFKNQAVPALEGDAAAYGYNVLSDISQDWSYDTLMMNAEPELKVNTDPEQVKAMLAKMEDALGSLKDAKGSGRMITDSEIAGQEALGVMYVADAEFEKGDADVKIYLVRRPESGDWLIKSFDVTPK